MKHAALICAGGLALAAVIALPAEAKKKPPADPGAQVCELQWDATFGKVELKQNYSGTGSLQSEDFQVSRALPGSGNWRASISMSQYAYAGTMTSVSRLYALSLDGPYEKGRNQRLIVAMPQGEPLIVKMEYGALSIFLSEEQLTRLLAARQRLTYRIVTVDRSGKETKLLREGWFDLSGVADQPLAGLPLAHDRAKAVMDKARAGPDAPCALAYAAEMNLMDSDEAVRKWLTLDCGESWSSAAGAFSLGLSSFSWQPLQRGGADLRFGVSYRVAAPLDRQNFLTDPDDPSRYGRVEVNFGARDWGLNYRENPPAVRERQSGELRRGKFVARKWLSQSGTTGFFWSEFSQLLAGAGDFEITAYDSVSGKTLRTTLPWSELTTAEDELRMGLARLAARERDPLQQCKAKVDAEYGTEQIIVT